MREKKTSSLLYFEIPMFPLFSSRVYFAGREMEKFLKLLWAAFTINAFKVFIVHVYAYFDMHLHRNFSRSQLYLHTIIFSL